MRLAQVLAALAVAAPCAAAAAEIGCGEAIEASGSYALRESCTCTANAPCITVSASDVVLNLDDKTITCEPVDPPRSRNELAFGILASSVERFSLLGADPSARAAAGAITGCHIGLIASYSKGVHVDRVDFSGNTYIGASTAFSSDVTFTRNTVDGIGGFVGADGHNGYAIAFNGCGTNCMLSGNTVRNVRSQPGAKAPVSGEGVGVVVSAGSSSVVIEHNWFENEHEESRAIGVFLSDDATARIERNAFTGFWLAIGGTGKAAVTNNRITMRSASAMPDGHAIDTFGDATHCASGNVIVNYRVPMGRTRVCGRNQIHMEPRPAARRGKARAADKPPAAR